MKPSIQHTSTGAEEARRHLPAIIDVAVAGHTTIITRGSRAVAAVVPAVSARALAAPISGSDCPAHWQDSTAKSEEPADPEGARHHAEQVLQCDGRSRQVSKMQPSKNDCSLQIKISDFNLQG